MSSRTQTSKAGERYAALPSTIHEVKPSPAISDANAWDDLGLLLVGGNDTEVLMHSLAEAGLSRIVRAANGLDAIRILDADPSLNIVLTPLEVAELDGFGLIRAILKRPLPMVVSLCGEAEPLLAACAKLVASERSDRFLGLLPLSANRSELVTFLGRARLALVHDRALKPEPMPLAEIVQGIDAGQFEPFFQPKLRLSDGAVLGAEALARWRHPNAGLIPPVRFIDVLESSGKLGSLTSQMLTMSLAHAKTWRNIAPNVGVSVNLSLSFLATHGSSNAIAAAARAAGLPSDAIGLEVAQSIATSKVGACLENIARLRLRGFRLCSDDFGVGESPLEVLTRVPFQELKIDREFMMRAHAGSREASVLEAIIPFAKRLGMSTVAEGVESRAEWDYLREIGCDAAQGYWMAKPMDAKAFHAWIAGLSDTPVR